MAKARTTRSKKPAAKKNAPQPRRSARTTRTLAPPPSAEMIKRLPKAPADYEETARRFAAALAATRFRGVVTPARLRSLVARGERLALAAERARLKHEAVERRRIVAESEAWKAMLSTWRMVVAAAPDRPELEAQFAFMREYMSTSRDATPTPEPAKPSE